MLPSNGTIRRSKRGSSTKPCFQDKKLSISEFLKYCLCFFNSGQIPSVGGDDTSPEDREKAAEQEKLRQEAIKQAEVERRTKHKKMEEERENMRQGIRDRVSYEF